MALTVVANKDIKGLIFIYAVPNGVNVTWIWSIHEIKEKVKMEHKCQSHLMSNHKTNHCFVLLHAKIKARFMYKSFIALI